MKTWLRYFFYFLCPLLVILIIWLIYTFFDGLFSIADRGASIALAAIALLLAGGIALYVTIRKCQSMTHLFTVSSERQRKKIIDRLQQLLNEELPAEKLAEPMGSSLFQGRYSIYLWMYEPVEMEDRQEGVFVRAPRQLMDIIIAEGHSASFLD